MKIAQDQHYESQDWWRWSVWIDADAAELAKISKVVWHLHPTFPNPVQEVSNRSDKFRLKTAGWGTFRVRAEVLMLDGKKRILLHELELNYPDGNEAME